MINLTNKFVLSGVLQESHFDIYSTHIRYKLVINGITVSGFHQKKWNQDAYLRMVRLCDKLETKIPSSVYANDEKLGYMPHDNPTRLYVTGQISSSADGRIYFNADYVALSQNDNDNLAIRLDGRFGIYKGKSVLLNVVNDTPRLFQIEKPKNVGDDSVVYAVSCLYKPSYQIIGDTVITNSRDELIAAEAIQTANTLSDDSVKNLMLEWSICNE